MSVKSLGEPIAGTGNLYAWGEGQILKLFGSEAPAGWVEHMAQVDQALHAAGLPVPAVEGPIEIDDALGLIYERIEGATLAQELLGSPDITPETIVRLAHIFAEVHAQIHACGPIAELPDQRSLFPRVIQGIDVLPADLKEATLKALEDLPPGRQLCHGDFHPYNVLQSPRGPIVIDWNNAHIGNPLEDVARSTLMLAGARVSEGVPEAPVAAFNEAYLERYFQLRPGDRQELAAWEPIVAAVRLCDNIPQLEEWLLDKVRTGLS